MSSTSDKQVHMGRIILRTALLVFVLTGSLAGFIGLGIQVAAMLGGTP